MANAVQTAPSKKEVETIKLDGGEEVVKGSNEHLFLTQEFDTSKKYMFELVEQTPERELPVINMVTKRAAEHVRFKPYQNIVLTSQIVWKGQRRMLRYYDGCTSIFQDKQPKEKETIDALIEGTSRDKYKFLEGKFGCYGDERMLLLYLNSCSWNLESPFKTKTSNTIFIPSNADKRATAQALKIDQAEKALQYAKEATEVKMRIHADYLGIAVVDYDSGNDLTEKEIRTEYRSFALQNAAMFIESYGNNAMESKYYINKALETGAISNKFNPNKATWGSSNTTICDISGLKSTESIAQRLFEFSQSEDGAEFLIQLKAVSE